MKFITKYEFYIYLINNVQMTFKQIKKKQREKIKCFTK